MGRFLLLVFFLCNSLISELSAQHNSSEKEWKAVWISSSDANDQPNTWLKYRKTVDMKSIPKSAIARIGVDSKYWLWINGEMVVFEGGLKRGPNPKDTYYDKVDLAPYLKRGENTIAILMCYFGKPSFSHNDSGKAGLIFDCQDNGVSILSDKSWKCEINSAFSSCSEPFPNFRLAESSLHFDARKDNPLWIGKNYDDRDMPQAVEIARAGESPWNGLVCRSIPLWKFGELTDYVSQTQSGDTIICTLPYNAQITPYIKLKSDAGKHISIMTDNYLTYNGGADYIRCEYITKDGVQEYENLGWINGHKVYYVVPKGAKVLDVKYRESGYDAEFVGTFNCSDTLYNNFWKKALRTLYLTMRDSYMDCPDRERSQWTGDAVNESGESFYVLSPSASLLTRKWLYDICNWQRPDGVIYAPVPSSNWDKELPGQVMASLGYYGLWNYYQNTGDRQILIDLYPSVKRYLSLWTKSEHGTIQLRDGGWNWGDWGDNIDILPLQNCWYYLTIKGMMHIAKELGYTDDEDGYRVEMSALKTAFNNHFWSGKEYRNPNYVKKTDDRVQALAVVSGLADKDKYPHIESIFQTEQHASPYMEKYVFEAHMVMGRGKDGLSRHNQRFATMVQDSRFTTLFEGWGIGSEGFGGGSVNHAWSGGGLTIAYQYICGIVPLEAGYKSVGIFPQPSGLKWAKASSQSVMGNVSSSFDNNANRFILNVIIPKNAKGVVGVPYGEYNEIKIDGIVVWKSGNHLINRIAKPSLHNNHSHISFQVGDGSHEIIAVKN